MIYLYPEVYLKGVIRNRETQGDKVQSVKTKKKMKLSYREYA